MSLESFVAAPGPSSRTVRLPDGRVLTVPDGWELLPPGDRSIPTSTFGRGSSFGHSRLTFVGLFALCRPIYKQASAGHHLFPCFQTGECLYHSVLAPAGPNFS